MKRTSGNKSLEIYGCWIKILQYFHMATRQTSDGRWLVDQTDIIQEVGQYYNSVLSTSNPTDLDCTLNHVKVIVSDSINQNLIKEDDAEEIKKAVFVMHPLEAPSREPMTK